MIIMEILDIRNQCLVQVARALKKPESNLAELESISLAAQEYYSTGLLNQDIYAEIKNTQTHPYIYDGTPFVPQGAKQITAKYNLSINAFHRLRSLADALRRDIEDKTISQDGRINYANPDWIKSHVLKTDHNYLYPQDGLAVILAKMLAQKIK